MVILPCRRANPVEIIADPVEISADLVGRWHRRDVPFELSANLVGRMKRRLLYYKGAPKLSNKNADLFGDGPGGCVQASGAYFGRCP